MRILFDLGHPAHVHYFKYLIKLLKKNGNQILIIAREKDVTHHLLETMEYRIYQRKRLKNIIRQNFYLFDNLRLYKYSVLF